MSQSASKPHNLWSLTVLCLLRVKPMHPYELQQRIRDWHKDDFLDLKRGSLYHAIERLRRDDAIEPIETTREGRRPERTVYRLTDVGERRLLHWLQEMLAKPVREPSQFFAALSFLSHLSPDSVQTHLQERAASLEEEIAGLDAVLATMVPRIGRLVLIEVEYARAMRRAELAWVQSFQKELQAGILSWDPQEILRWGPKLPEPESERKFIRAPSLGDRHEHGNS